MPICQPRCLFAAPPSMLFLLMLLLLLAHSCMPRSLDAQKPGCLEAWMPRSLVAQKPGRP